MRTHLYYFILYLIVVFFSFAVPKLVMGSVPPHADNVAPVFGVIDGRPTHRRYARSLANADVGEPRTVRLVYFLPNDQDFRPEVVQRMKDEIRRLQTFYREQMQAHGHGARTFRVETDTQGEPVVHRVNGQYHNSYYQRDDVEGTTLAEIEPLFDVNENIYMIVIDNHRRRIGPLIGVAGYGRRINRTAGYVLLPGEFTFENSAHELGHAFGLNHDFRDDAYIMSYGVGRDELSACNANFLAVHAYFNTDVRMDDATQPSIEHISSFRYRVGSNSVPVQLKVEDPEGLHQALIFVGTKPPHSAAGFPEVTACRALTGEQHTVIEFDYDGGVPSHGFRNLASSVTHWFSVAVVDVSGNVTTKFFRLIETPPGDFTTFSAHTGHAHSMAFSPNGSILASVSYDETVKLWDMKAKGNVEVFHRATSFRDEATSVAFSPDGKTLAFGSWATVMLWDIKTREQIGTLIGHDDSFWVGCVAFSRDGKTLASGSGDWTIKLWDVQTHENIATLEGHTRSVDSLSFSSDGRTLASGSGDSTVNLWDTVSHMKIATFQVDGSGVPSVAFSPDGSILAAADRNAAILWDVGTETQLATFGNRWGASSVEFLLEGTVIACGHYDGTVTLWDVETGVSIATLATDAAPDYDQIHSLAYSSEVSSLAAGTHYGNIVLWDTSEWSQSRDRMRKQTIPDPALRRAIQYALRKSPEDAITPADLTMLTFLVAQNDTIRSVIGLEFATNLRSANFHRNNISDIAPLARLTNLRSLSLYDNHVSDISPVMGLINLNTLRLGRNNISDISSLSALVNLNQLSLAGNKLSDTSALSNLSNLKVLHLAVNSISDISPLLANPGLGEGDTLFLRRNPLNFDAVNSHIPHLQDRGVTVSFIDRTPTTLEPISGDEQQGAPFEPLTDPFVVEVRDERGDVFEGVPVTFHVPDGFGRLSATNTTTDADGRAQSVLALGEHTGTIIVTVSAAEITEIAKLVTFTVVSEETPPRIPGDVNGDSVVNVFDLVQVAANFAKTGENDADVNGDGVVDVLDLLQVAEAIGGAGAAPSAYSSALSVFSAAEIESWIAQARGLNLMDARLERGIRFLEQLLAVLTPDETALLPNYPNPFNPETWIPYHLADGADVEIVIYDANGVLVKQLALGYQPAGYYAERGRAAYWDGRNESGESVVSGVYVYRLRAGDYAAARRMVIVK